jgi:hypothetical protein
MKYLMSTVAVVALVAGATVANAADPVVMPVMIAPAPQPIMVGPTKTITVGITGGVDDGTRFLDFGIDLDVAAAGGLGFTLGLFGALDDSPEREFGFLATVYKAFGPVTLSVYGGMSWLLVAADRTVTAGATVEYGGDVLSALVDLSRLWVNGAVDSTTLATEVGFALGPNTTVTPAAEFVFGGPTTLSIALAQVFGNTTVIPSFAVELGGPRTVSLAVEHVFGPATVMAGVDRVIGTSWTFWGGLSVEFGN